ncbi:hypothetical protein [Ligilactobacillus acidipiscis]|uniref:hypothetical protein n=1 Tax=Ligilactobacillus acidipiscis TaxID=89059 RepID=UPI0022E08D74|nr:hypothetical protein [Ligilactobacillus acidipiscis]
MKIETILNCVPKKSDATIRRRSLLFFGSSKKETILRCLNLLRVSTTFRQVDTIEEARDIKQTNLKQSDQIMAFVVLLTHYSLIKNKPDLRDENVESDIGLENLLLKIKAYYLQKYGVKDIPDEKEIKLAAQKYNRKDIITFNNEIERIQNNGSFELVGGIYVKIAKIPEKPAQLAQRMLLLKKLCDLVEDSERIEPYQKASVTWEGYSIDTFTQGKGKWPENFLGLQENYGPEYVRHLKYVVEDRNELFQIFREADIDRVKKIFTEIIFPEPNPSYINSLIDQINAITKDGNDIASNVRTDIASQLNTLLEGGYKSIIEFETSLENLLIKSEVIEKEFTDVKNMKENKKAIENFQLDVDSKSKKEHAKNFYIHLTNKKI